MSVIQNCHCQTLKYLHEEEQCQAYIRICKDHPRKKKSQNIPYISPMTKCLCVWIKYPHIIHHHKEVKSEWSFKDAIVFHAELKKQKKSRMIKISRTVSVSPDLKPIDYNIYFKHVPTWNHDYTLPYPDIMNELERFKQIECAEFGEEYTPKHYEYKELPKEREIKK